MRQKEWIKNIQDGDDDSVDALISELYPQIYSYVYVRMKGKDCSKDITQEVFLRFIRNIDHFDFRGKTKNYLLRIAVNCCNSWYREHQMELDHKELEDHGIEPAYKIGDDLRKLLHQLPQEQEEVLVLKYYEELKIREIAQILDLSPNTVKTRIRLGLEKMKQITRKEDWI